MKKSVYRRKMREAARALKDKGYGVTTAAGQLVLSFLGGGLRTPKKKTRAQQAPFQFESEHNPNISRWTGNPHEHKKELARSQRQQERQAAK